MMEDRMPARVISAGVPFRSLTAAGAAPVNGVAAVLSNVLGSNPKTITWKTIHAGGPSAINLVLQGTMLNPDQPTLSTDPESAITDADWFTLDTSTVTAGEQRTVVNQAVRAVRVRLVSKTGGTTTDADIFVAP
jgi:hypothetical protein